MPMPGQRLGRKRPDPLSRPTTRNPEYALGRLPAGQMNKTESRYHKEVIEPGLASGAILWAKFEGLAFKLAHDTRLTPDFALMLEDGTFECIDIKGAAILYKDDAKVKMKVAAAMFPMRFAVTWPNKGRGNGWHRQEVGK